MEDKVVKTDSEWKKELTPEQYHITREKGTERPFSGEYVDTKDKGIYKCSNCGLELFSSDTKYDSGTGWPSFYQAMDNKNIDFIEDTTMGIKRTEATCASCGAHLGHIFDDGPADKTGRRYCINSCALKLDKK